MGRAVAEVLVAKGAESRRHGLRWEALDETVDAL